jgi:hypothetical protein
MGPVVYSQWTHLVGTYDGTTLRLYVDSSPTVTLEVAGPIQLRRDRDASELIRRQADLERDKEVELAGVAKENKATAEAFFQTKEGLKAMKKASQALLESEEFNARDFGITIKDAKDELMLTKLKKIEAVKEAKQQYIDNMFSKTSRAILERFIQVKKELEEDDKKQQEEGELKLNKAFRVGASLAASDTKNNFFGDIAMVSVYTACVSSDKVRAHYLAARSGKSKEAQRMYALTSSKYEEALYFAYDDPMILRGFAQSLCGYLKIELSAVTKEGVSGAKVKIIEAIEKFRARNVPEGVAEILAALPREAEYADLVCQGFQAIKQVDPGFFSKGTASMNRADLVLIPETYGLNHPRSPKHHLETAGAIFQEVSKDLELHHVYGDVDLGWISALK